MRPVDPRDVTEGLSVRAYRVYFWNSARSASEEFELTEAPSVLEVIRWADDDAQGRSYELLALLSNGVAVELVSLPDTMRPG